MARFIRSAIAVLLLAGAAHANGFKDGASAYRNGDRTRALEIWHPLAEAGDRDAQFNIGILYAQGLGVPVDRAAALDWLGRAAEQGDVIAAYNLGILYSDAAAGDPDFTRAAKWYERAAARDHPGAMENLSLLLANGQGIEQDLTRAVKLSSVSEELECLIGDTSNNHKPRFARLAH